MWLLAEAEDQLMLENEDGERCEED